MGMLTTSESKSAAGGIGGVFGDRITHEVGRDVQRSSNGCE